MHIEIVNNLSDDALSRELWCFIILQGHIKLDSYHRQTRPSTRHKFKGPKWDSVDERSYNSALSRPLIIPPHIQKVARDAWAEEFGTVPIYIGWLNEDCRVK